jgi:hypothetical protein
MRRIPLLVVVAAVAACATALPALGATTQEFKAQFHDTPSSDCPQGVDTCGHGLVKGYGTAATTLTFTSFAPGPGLGCVTATGERVVTLNRDGSTLVLSLTGTICGQAVAGTFTISGGTGVFSGAVGGGTISGVAIRGIPSDAVSFRGTITLP